MEQKNQQLMYDCLLDMTPDSKGSKIHQEELKENSGIN